jgi:hypothetical protein
MNTSGGSSRVTQALILVVAVAIAGRLISDLLQPLIPALIAFGIVAAVVAVFLRRN